MNATFFVYRVMPQETAQNNDPPPTGWSGPAASAAAAVVIAAKVLRLPPSLLVSVFRQDALHGKTPTWEICGRGPVRIAEAAMALSGW
jgi:hypothetical protein